MQISHRLRHIAAALFIVPLCAVIQPAAGSERTQSANVVNVMSFGAPPGVVSGTLGSWVRSVPAADGNPLYVIQATASNTTTTDDIAATEWSVPAVVAESGSPGVVLAGSVNVYLYHRGAAAPAPPSGTFTYTFASKTLAGGTPNGWSQTVPNADGTPLWVMVATASGPSADDTIEASEFSAAVQLAQDNTTGLNVAGVRLFQRAASVPTALPDSTLTYTFSAGRTDLPKSVHGDLLLGSDGFIYFTSSAGGAGYGTVSRMAPDGTVSVVYAFASADVGASPYAGVIEGSDHNLYGTTYLGGKNGTGAVFKLTRNGDGTFSYTLLHEFDKGDTDPRLPYTALVQAGDGNLYGTTTLGGANNKGAIYRISPAGDFSIVHSFTGDDGEFPEGKLVVDTDGSLYGTTMLGGPDNRGVIYRLTTSGDYLRLYAFAKLGAFSTQGLATNTTGSNPRAGLLRTAPGVFYGTAYQGGAYGYGTLFRVTVTGDTADFSVVHTFGGWAFDGGFPLAAPVLGPDGNLYGTGDRGGYQNAGAVWMVTPGGTATMLHSFSIGGTLSTLSAGSLPYAGVLFANNSLYGVTYSDAILGAGVLYRLELDSGAGLPVDMTIAKKQAVEDESVDITWSAPGAISCDKFGFWDEPTSEADPKFITPTSGTEAVVPSLENVYVYGLACTDATDVVHYGFVGLDTKAPPQKSVDGGSIVGGGALSWLLLALLASLLFVKLIKETRSSCP